MLGSIRTRFSKRDPKKPLYYLCYRIGKKQVWEAAGSHKKTAERKLTETINALNDGTYVKVKEISFAEFAREWLQIYASVHVKESTFRSYRSVITQHLIPDLGHYPVTLITPHVVQQFLSAVLKKTTKRKKPTTTKTANNMLKLMKTVFKYACKWGYMRFNPAEDIESFPVSHEEMHFLEPEDIRALLNASLEPFRTLFLTAVMTGMRRGELLALQWGDIDWNSSRIFVRRTLFWFSCEEASERKHDERWKFGTPKTKNSYRTIPMSPELKKALQIHHIKSPVNEHGLVFCSKEGKPIDPDNMVKREFHYALTTAGLRRIRFHDLRHTCAAVLIAADFNPKFIQMFLGHASIQTTMDRYGHLFKIDNEKVGDRIDQTVFEKSNKNLTESAEPSKSTQMQD